jgi:hypothetical protein
VNQTEAMSIVAYLNRAGLVGAMNGQGAVWADALADVSYATAQEVARGMARERTSDRRWVTPGDVAAEVARVRRARVAAMPSPQPPEELDGVPAREIAWTRAYVAAIGDGQDEATADATACRAAGVTRAAVEAVHRPVTALVAQAAKTTHIPRRQP